MKIQIINHLDEDSDDAVAAIAEVAQSYVDIVCADHEIAPAEIRFTRGAKETDSGWLAMVLAEAPTVADALGFHDVDPRGLPYGRAFLSVVPDRTLLHDASGHGASLAGVVTHELAEMLGDRFANLWSVGTVRDPRHPRRTFGAVAYELADPVQDNAFTLHTKNGVVVDCSDYVLPSYFNPLTPPTQYTSHIGAAVGPMVVAPGGYLIVAQQHGETQLFGRRLGTKRERVFHKDVDPPAWREAIRALPFSRSQRRAKQEQRP